MVTRPTMFAERVCHQLTACGAIPIPFPCIEIENYKLTSATIDKFNRLKEFQAIIFVSRIAAIKTAELLRNLNLSLPPTNIFAVGIKTAHQLEQYGVKNVIYPQHQFSGIALINEGLLNGVRSGEVLIIKGCGGSQELGTAIRKQGVKVAYAEVYKRVKPQTSLALNEHLIVQIILVTSKDILNNLFQMTEESSRNILCNLQLIVGSSALGVLAKELGFCKPAIIAKSPSDEDMLSALSHFYNRQAGKEKAMHQPVNNS